MSRGPLNLLIDTLAAAFLLTMAVTGYVLRFPLPPGTNRTHVLWGLSRHEWGELHSWASLGLLLVLAIHLVLHWDWLVTMIRRRFAWMQNDGASSGRRAGLITVAAMILLAALFALAAHRSVRERAVPLHPLDEPSSDGAAATAKEPRVGEVDFWEDIMPVFEASCIKCHGPIRQASGFRADQRGDFFLPRDGAALVVPGDVAASRLLKIVSGQEPAMQAAAAHRLPPEDILVLETWIEAGAAWPAK